MLNKIRTKASAGLLTLAMALSLTALSSVGAHAATAPPFKVDADGITLTDGSTFQDGGHVNIHADVAYSGDLHFESKCITRTDAECAGALHDAAQYIGKTNIPWSAFGLDLSDIAGFCVTWVQISHLNPHFGVEFGTQFCSQLPTPPVVDPIPMPAQITPIPPTCTTDGSLPPLVANEFYNSGYLDDPKGGPNDFLAVHTVKEGLNRVFVDGSTVVIQRLSVLPRLTEGCGTTTTNDPPKPATLAATGLDPRLTLVLAVVLLGAGGGVVLIRRRKVAHSS